MNWQLSYAARRRRTIKLICLLAVCLALLSVAVWGLGRLQQDLVQRGAAALRSTVQQRAVQCYAVEGAYPQSLAYLEENYGLRINRQRYIVAYEVFAPNLLPDVTVLVKQ